MTLSEITPAAKKILITGATRGCGLALTNWLLQKGHVVIGCGTNGKLVTFFKGMFNHPSELFCIDITDDKMVEGWAKEVTKRIGAVDLVINNAAIINKNSPLWKVSDEELDLVLKTNVRGLVNIIRHFLPPMIDKEKGVIANISSYWGREGSANVGPYCASKFAVEGLTQSLAAELPSGMGAVAVNPGIINTDMLQSCFGASAEKYPLPENWAEIAGPFFLSLGEKDNGRSLTVGSTNT